MSMALKRDLFCVFMLWTPLMKPFQFGLPGVNSGVAISNSAMQAIGCVAARMCSTNNCPTGIATQNPELRQRLNIEKSSVQLGNFFSASIELMQVMARACGHNHLNQFTQDDLATWHREMAMLSGVKYSGLLSLVDK